MSYQIYFQELDTLNKIDYLFNNVDLDMYLLQHDSLLQRDNSFDNNYDYIDKFTDYIYTIFNNIYLLLKFIFNVIIFPIKMIITFINSVFNIIEKFLQKVKKKIFFIQELKQKNVSNLKEINNLKEEIKELTNEKKNFKNNIYKLKQTLKYYNLSKNKLDYYLEFTSDKLDDSLKKNNEQKKIIDNLNKKIEDFKNRINNLQIYEESPINRQKRKAAAKANKKLCNNN